MTTRTDDQLRIGYYGYYPTILDPAPGPWGGREMFDLHPVDAWDRILTWLAEHGVDFVIAVVSPKFRDGVFHDWPFHYVCDLDEFPEAQMFPPAVVARQRDIVNQVVNRATALGLDVYFTHCNFCAPRAFVESHAPLWTKYLRTRGAGCASHDTCNFFGTIVGNVCWSEPAYRDFMVTCWQRFFEAIPSAAGFMITPGEFNQCRCPACNSPSLDKSDIAHARGLMQADFVDTFSAEMQRLGRQSMVRAWYLESDPDSIPATALLRKYHVFDCFDAPMDPDSQSLLKGTKPVYLMCEQNGENAAQLLWFKPDYWRNVGQGLRNSRAAGATISHNIDWGMNGMVHPVASLNLEAFLHYSRTDKDGEVDWAARIGTIFGSQTGSTILEALELLAEFPMNVTRVIFLGTEGYTYGPIQPCDEAFAPDPWGVLARNWLPPDWARGDVGRLHNYWQYLGENPFVALDGISKYALSDGERCPLQLMQQTVEAATQACRLLQNVEKDVTHAARGHWDALLGNARITEAHANMLLHSIRTALFIRAARNPANHKQYIELVSQAVAEHSGALEALRTQIGWMNAQPHGMLNYRNWLRLRSPSYNSYHAIMFTPLQLMDLEHDNLLQWARELGVSVDQEAAPFEAMRGMTARPVPLLRRQLWQPES